ncbi:DNA polymerase V [Trabulsiella odontotermitis]|uniref:DNA polymerase V n=1 Tax=Trabulsiella odontotermitis TaxID=379893 RepID=UPI003AC2A664
MPRRHDIEAAYRAAIQHEQNGRQTVTTDRFVQELERRNWHWSHREANQWIEVSICTFKDISTQEGENRTFMLFNPNGGL